MTPFAGLGGRLTRLDGHGTAVRALHATFRLEFVEIPTDRRCVYAEGLRKIIDTLKPALLQPNCDVRAT
jgi:hypothetical protein